MSDEKIERILNWKKLQALTEKTIVDKEELMIEIAKIRDQGYAVDDEEVEPGGRCIAAPLRDRAGNVIAAVSVMGPTTRIRQKDFQKLAGVVKKEVMKASISLGYRDATQAGILEDTRQISAKGAMV